MFLVTQLFPHSGQQYWIHDSFIHSATVYRYRCGHLHKYPYGRRFIAASNRCTTKSLSKLLTTCLAKITCHFREYCNGIYNRTRVNCFWIVDNSQQALNRIRKTNYFSPAKHFYSFDCATLYTSIPHDSLKIVLTSLVKEAYRVRGNKFLVVDRYGNACWSDTLSTASYKNSIY